MLKVSKEKNIIKLENVKNLSYKKKDKTIKSLPNKKVVYIEGKPGKDGETPSTEQLLDIIKPLIPEVKDGKTPTKEELKEIIKTEIPTVEEIAKIVVPQIPVIKGDKGDKLKFSDLTIDERASLEGPRGVPGMTVRLSDIYEGTWSATGDYLVDEIVVYNDNTYFAKRRNKGVTPGTDDFIWQFLAPYTGGTTATPTLQEVTDEGNTTTNDIIVPDEVYGAGWNGDLSVPTKNALYDKIETLGSGASIGGAMTSGTAGSVLFVDPNAIIAQNNQDFFWNNTLKSLLISSTLGSELLTNGTFTGNATGWTVPSGYAYSSNTVVHSSNGTGALQPSTALTTVIAGFEYQYSIDISALTVGTATLACGGVTLVAITANGTYTGKFVATSNANLTVTPTSTARFTVDNISLKRLSGGSIYAGSHVGDTHTAVKSALGTTTSSGFIAENTTLATSGVQQASPSYLRKGQGYLSNTSASFPFEVQDYVIGKVNITPYGQWINQWRGNNGSWTEFLSFDADPVGLGFNFTGPATSGSTPGSARFATFNNSGSNTWLDFKLGGTRRASFGVNNSGEITFNSTGDVVNFTNSSNANLAQISTTGIINAGGSFNALRVTAGNSTTTPPTTFSNYGSTSLKTTIITTNTTLTDDYTQVIVDCSSNDVCTGTPSVTDCTTYTASGEATCISHLPCAWYAGDSCSAFDNEFGMGTCSGTPGCSANTSSCSPYNSDQTTCEAADDTYGGSCTWDAGSNTCPSQDCTTCAGAGCTPNLGGDCSVFSDGGGDGTACNAAPCGACSYDSGSGVCSGSYFISCDGDNTTPSCNGTYYTGGCSGTYGAACTGTATCSGYGSETPCEAEAGCNWTSGVEITLPASPVEQTYWIAKDYTAGALTILPNSGQTVNNTTSITSSSTAGVGWMLTWVESKANWYVMSAH